MNDNLRETILAKAKGALDESNAENSEKKYNDLLDDLERAFGKNHKEVAAELQRIAKAIEDEGQIDASFNFKQRTCEVMLKRSMAERHQGRAPKPPQQYTPEPMRVYSSPRQALLGTCEFVCLPTVDIDRDCDFYKRVLQAEQAFKHEAGTRIIALRVSSGPLLLLVATDSLNTCQPVYTIDDLSSITAEFDKHDVKMQGDPVPTGVGTLYGFIDPSGHRFALIDKKRRA